GEDDTACHAPGRSGISTHSSITGMLERIGMVKGGRCPCAKLPRIPASRNKGAAMCGRFALLSTREEVEAFFALLNLDDFPARYNIAPTQPILTVLAGEPRRPGSNLPERRALLVRWGLIPAWAKDPKSVPLLFNARSDTALERDPYKAALRHRRALVPASGLC